MIGSERVKVSHDLMVDAVNSTQPTSVLFSLDHWYHQQRYFTTLLHCPRKTATLQMDTSDLSHRKVCSEAKTSVPVVSDKLGE